MIKKSLSISSWVVHGVYAGLCLVMIVIFLLSEACYPTNYEMSANLSQIAGIGGALLSFFPFWLLGFGLNIALFVTHITDKAERKTSRIVCQSVHTVLCVAVNIMLWCSAFAVFITATGGV